MTSSIVRTLDKNRWMTNTVDIGRLKLADIVWPGAHNTGMDKKDPNYEVVLGHWTTCQNDSFAWQLANGVRAFDIRLGCTAGPQIPVLYFHTDFFDESDIVRYCWSAISMKAVYAERLHLRA